MTDEIKCIAGCKAYSGGELYHHKNCTHYPGSFSEMYDKLKSKEKTTAYCGEYTSAGWSNCSGCNGRGRIYE